MKDQTNYALLIFLNLAIVWLTVKDIKKQKKSLFKVMLALEVLLILLTLLLLYLLIMGKAPVESAFILFLFTLIFLLDAVMLILKFIYRKN